MSGYTAADTLRLAKRAHNTKRTYLLVNPLQAKHLPVSPTRALEMMWVLGMRLSAEFPETRLVIGFAETATAIGAMAASCFDDSCVYVHTTREPLPEGRFLEFREEHSHAVEQTLYCGEMEAWLAETSTVIFIDDEISTGKTILNMANQLKARFPQLREKRLVAASVMNRVTEADEARLAAAGIVCRYLVKLPQTDYTRAVERFAITEAVEPPELPGPREWRRLPPAALCEPRMGVPAFDYLDACRRRAEKLLPQLQELLDPAGTILVLGTEECMLPALVLGAVLENPGGFSHVRCHATTRSPIGICGQPDYPVREGWRLRSFYDPDRVTYLYNLERYDAAVVVTDRAGEAGLRSLSAALEVHGCGQRFLAGGED